MTRKSHKKRNVLTRKKAARTITALGFEEMKRFNPIVGTAIAMLRRSEVTTADKDHAVAVLGYCWWDLDDELLMDFAALMIDGEHIEEELVQRIMQLATQETSPLNPGGLAASEKPLH
jgi:hypothetical protein